MWYNYRILVVSLKLNVDVIFIKFDLFFDLFIFLIYLLEVNLMMERDF